MQIAFIVQEKTEHGAKKKELGSVGPLLRAGPVEIIDKSAEVWTRKKPFQ